MKKFLFSFIFLLCSGFSAVAESENAELGAVRFWAENKGAQILEILADKNLERKYAELDEILYKDIDLDYASRFVMGRYWKQMSEEQKQTYVPLFKRYVASLYKSFPLDVPMGSIGYKIEKIVPNKDFYEVFCTVNINQKNIRQNAENNAKIGVLFSLIRENGNIKVRDLKIAESSLLVTYRERFNKMIHQDNDDEIDWFLDDLMALTEDKERENELKLMEN